jgi:hypothetical protein
LLNSRTFILPESSLQQLRLKLANFVLSIPTATD